MVVHCTSGLEHSDAECSNIANDSFFPDLASGIYMMYCRPDCSYAKRSAGWKLRQRGEERKEHSLSNRRRKKDKQQTNSKSAASGMRLHSAPSLLFHLSPSVALSLSLTASLMWARIRLLCFCCIILQLYCCTESLIQDQSQHWKSWLAS